MDPFDFSNAQTASTPIADAQKPVLADVEWQMASSAVPPIDFKVQLNAEQYVAVTADPGPMLVLAGAGSGKTRTLTYRVAYLLSQGVQPWQILLITFTNKAAKEMLQRVEDLTGVPQHRFWGGTFHHIGQKFLRLYGHVVELPKDFIIVDQGDAEAILTEAIREVEPAFSRNKDNPKTRIIAEVISYARNTFKSISVVLEEKYPYFKHLAQTIQAFAKCYRLKKRKQNVVDYDDLLELWLDVLNKDEATAQAFQERFKHILVDEYQDTNCLQAALIDRLANHHQVMAVGDDAQCIYTWRGAHFENILTFPDRHPGTRIFKIETNYRSSPQILALANAVLENQSHHQGYEKTLRTALPNRQKPYLVQAVDSRNQAQFIVRRIHGLLNEGYSPRDIVVLYRAHYQAMDLQMEFSRSQIPYVITSGVRFFEQSHIKDLLSQIRFVWNPEDTVAFFRTACLIPKIGPKTAERLLEMAKKRLLAEGGTLIRHLNHETVMAKVPEEAKDDWNDMVLTLQNLEESLRPPSASLSKTGDDLFAAKPLASTFIPKKPHELIQIAIEGWYGDFLRTLHTNWIARRDDLDSLVTFAERYEDMAELLNQVVLLNSESTERSAEEPMDAIRLTTIHQSKGLEFPVVFVIGLAEGLFPIKRAVDEGQIDEERRLFYVAVTRAMKELYLSYPMVHFQGGPPIRLQMSSFLQELPDHTYELLHLGMGKRY